MCTAFERLSGIRHFDIDLRLFWEGGHLFKGLGPTLRLFFHRLDSIRLTMTMTGPSFTHPEPSGAAGRFATLLQHATSLKRLTFVVPRSNPKAAFDVIQCLEKVAGSLRTLSLDGKLNVVVPDFLAHVSSIPIVRRLHTLIFSDWYHASGVDGMRGREEDEGESP
jgi:hypothetical protein